MRGCRKEMCPWEARPVSAAGQPGDTNHLMLIQQPGAGALAEGSVAAARAGRVTGLPWPVCTRVCPARSLLCIAAGKGSNELRCCRQEPPAARLVAAARTCSPAPSSAELPPLCAPLLVLAPCLR